jgi:hypothetical protein
VVEKPDDSASNDPRSETGHSRREFLTDTVAASGIAVFCGWNAATSAEPVKAEVTVNPRLFTFVGGKTGGWSVVSIKAVVGDPLPVVDRLDGVAGAVAALPDGGKWMLRGVTSNDRYVTCDEKDRLFKKQAALGRPEATQMALIPIRKNARWWALTQDERRVELVSGGWNWCQFIFRTREGGEKCTDTSFSPDTSFRDEGEWSRRKETPYRCEKRKTPRGSSLGVALHLSWQVGSSKTV